MAAPSPSEPETYFCVDVEASGPVPILYSMLSIGVVVVEEAADGALRPGASLYLELAPRFPCVEAEAVKIAGLDLERLAREGLPAKEALERLAAFVRAHTPSGRRAIFVGHNAVFDWMMVHSYFVHEGVKNPFGYSALDSKALAMGIFGLRYRETSKERLAELLPLAPEDLALKHRADYDALYQAELFCGLMSRLRARK